MALWDWKAAEKWERNISINSLLLCFKFRTVLQIFTTVCKLEVLTSPNQPFYLAFQNYWWIAQGNWFILKTITFTFSLWGNLLCKGSPGTCGWGRPSTCKTPLPQHAFGLVVCYHWLQTSPGCYWEMWSNSYTWTVGNKCRKCLIFMRTEFGAGKCGITSFEPWADLLWVQGWTRHLLKSHPASVILCS